MQLMADGAQKVCQNCGEPLRDGADFCTKCGYSPSVDYSAVSDVPFIALAPVERVNFAKRMGRVLRLLFMTIGTVAVCMIAIGISVLVTSSVGSNPYVEVDRATYQSAMNYVNEIRSNAMDSVIKDITLKQGDMENRNLIDEYWTLFKNVLTTNKVDTKEGYYYVYSCYGTWLSEYYARKNEYLADKSGIFSFIYQDDALRYRQTADWCYAALQNSTSESQLREIMVYLQEKDIFSDNTIDKIEDILAGNDASTMSITDIAA